MSSAPNGTRISWATDVNSSREWAPSFQNYKDNEAYWQLRDVMDDVANRYRTSLVNRRLILIAGKIIKTKNSITTTGSKSVVVKSKQ